MDSVKTYINGTTGGPVRVYVRDGRIIRITPIEFDDSDAPSWKIDARGRTFAPPRKTTLAPYSLAWRSMVYSPQRILTPLKRVDFDPGGQRNCRKRGESGYEPISWDAAADIVSDEIKRIKRKYGPAAMLSTASSHHLWGNIGYRHNAYFRFMNLVGYTYADHNPDNSAAGFRWANKIDFRGTRSNINHPGGQHIPRLRIPECILDGKSRWRGKGFCGSSIEAQFKPYRYPEDGFPEIQMYYRYGGSFIGTMTETNRYVEAYRTDRLPFVVNQSIWFEGETRFADIILPACTNFERWDISEFANCSGYVTDSFTQVNHRVVTLQQKCIEPVGESKSDYDIFAFLAKRLGLFDAFTEGGMDELDWVKRYFNLTDLPKYISWEDFEKKGYFVVPLPENYTPTPALRWFADGIVLIDPEKALGQKQLVDACPYGAIFWNETARSPQKCTLCAHLLDEGWKEPRCVQACPTGAMRIFKLESDGWQAMGGKR